MINSKKEVFDTQTTYRLYRTVRDIICPSISKENISSYKIVFQDNLLPVQVFYPKKVSDISGIIIYVPGDSVLTKCHDKYAKICSDLAVELDKLIIAIDYYDIQKSYPNSLNKIQEIIEYLYKELKSSGISNKNITLMGDSSGGNFISAITFRLLKNNSNCINKEILLYPLLSGDYYKNSKYSSIKTSIDTNKVFISNLRKYMRNYAKEKKNYLREDVCPILNSNYKNYPKTLIITGDLDPLRDEGKDFFSKLEDANYLNIKYATHGFLGTNDFDIKREYLSKIKEFI